MATVVLAAAGSAIGGSIGGTFAGLTSAVIGRAIGVSIGRRIDERLLGGGSEPVETGQIDRYRIMGAQEGRAIPKVFGRMRVGGHVIWATRYKETVSESGGGKGRGPVRREFSYSVSLAIALCDGVIGRVGRIWADGEEVSRKDLNMRVYLGDESQEPDPLIEAVEGAGQVPAYRGLAYVVLEDLDLGRFGNRVPQFSFEVIRPVEADAPGAEVDLAHGISGVALMPGTGEYALATTPVHFSDGLGRNKSANVNSPSGETDFVTSMAALNGEMPGCSAVSLIVSWFGDDLRAGECRLKPKVEQTDVDGVGMPWHVCGVSRESAEQVPQKDGLPIYGGTPTDASVVEAIRHLNGQGKEVMFYPFLLMEQAEGNELPNPWTGLEGQPVLPWRGRITSSLAPGMAGTPDGSEAARNEVEGFFGSAEAQDFAIDGDQVVYFGPPEWSYRRFILHYAMLCKLAGGVESFCIGSEMRGLTQIRGAANSFPAVDQLIRLAEDVRGILGPDVKLSYAADWSEYFGYHPQDSSGDAFFHLDPLWAHEDIDFVGIDNYMPLSDWRDGEDHLDASWGSIYALEYLKANVEGGEGYDWYYHSNEARDAQIRSEIEDGAHGEDWLWRNKDFRGWWQNPHYNRIGGVRAAEPTAWEPQSKPIRFTEFGCAAIDKGTNQPNKFLDPKSSESAVPAFSNGARDEFMQRQYFAAVLGYWKRAGVNPVSEVYGAPMLDLQHAYAWAWDARPYPAFPNNRELWSDAANYSAGHWLNGRTSGSALSDVIRDICDSAGLTAIDATQAHGVVQGYVIDGSDSGRAALQPLMLAYGVDGYEADGLLRFSNRTGQSEITLTPDRFAVIDGQEGLAEHLRLDDHEDPDRVRVGFTQADGGFETIWEEASRPATRAENVMVSQVPLALTRGEGRLLAERWLSETPLSRDRLSFALAPSMRGLRVGQNVQLCDSTYRVDRVEHSEVLSCEAVRIDPEVYRRGQIDDDAGSTVKFAAPVPVAPVFMDLPLIKGDVLPHAPHVAVTATPWPGNVGVFLGDGVGGFDLSLQIPSRATIGVSENELGPAPMGVVDRGPGLRVRLSSGHLTDATWANVLNGANRVAIGNASGGAWEVFQFQTAELVAPDTYMLRNRLRGQAGTNADMPDLWPEGSLVVFLDEAVGQLPLPPTQRNRPLDFRVGPVSRALDDPSFVADTLAFSGVGLRPYSPCHLRFEVGSNADRFNWVRRTRIEGDGWDSLSVPLGEETESYLVKVIADGDVVREVLTEAPSWDYPHGLKAADGVTSYQVSVAQISAVVGPGPAALITVAA